METFCDVILVTFFSDVKRWRH